MLVRCAEYLYYRKDPEYVSTLEKCTAADLSYQFRDEYPIASLCRLRLNIMAYSGHNPSLYLLFLDIIQDMKLTNVDCPTLVASLVILRVMESHVLKPQNLELHLASFNHGLNVLQAFAVFSWGPSEALIEFSTYCSEYDLKLVKKKKKFSNDTKCGRLTAEMEYADEKDEKIDDADEEDNIDDEDLYVVEHLDEDKWFEYLQKKLKSSLDSQETAHLGAVLGRAGGGEYASIFDLLLGVVRRCREEMCEEDYKDENMSTDQQSYQLNNCLIVLSAMTRWNKSRIAPKHEKNKQALDLDWPITTEPTKENLIKSLKLKRHIKIGADTIVFDADAVIKVFDESSLMRSIKIPLVGRTVFHLYKLVNDVKLTADKLFWEVHGGEENLVVKACDKEDIFKSGWYGWDGRRASSFTGLRPDMKEENTWVCLGCPLSEANRSGTVWKLWEGWEKRRLQAV